MLRGVRGGAVPPPHGRRAMAQTTETLEADRPVAWQVAERDAEERWPVHKTVLFVVASSALLWGGIFALIGWLW